MAIPSVKTLRRVSYFALFILTAAATLQIASQSPSPATSRIKAADAERTASGAAAVREANRYDKLPISFEPNQGQTNQAVQFLARGSGYTLFLEPDQAVLSLFATSSAMPPGEAATHKVVPPRTFSTVGLKLIGAVKAALADAEDRLPGTATT